MWSLQIKLQLKISFYAKDPKKMLLTMPFAYADGLEGYLPISMDHARFFNLSLQEGIRIVVASSQPDDALLASCQ